MKKIIGVILSAVMMCAAFTALAQNDSEGVTVTFNGDVMEFDVEPLIENNRVLVPFRAIFEALGCNVSYSDAEGMQLVTATRGDNSIIIQIGAYDYCLNGNVEAIDSPAIIKDSRTLVPIRAVSEAFDADVNWDGDTKTVVITTKQGQHKITPVTSSKEIKAEDGTILINIAYTYPVIDNPDENEFIAKLNSEYKEYAENFANDAEAYVEDAKLLLEQKGEDYWAMEYELSYQVQTDKKDILSITNYCYYNLGGAHPNTERISRTFDMANEKELVLSDLINGNEDERHTMIYDVFVTYFEENYAEYMSAEIATAVDEEADNVKFYMSDDCLVLYFDVYQVAPYVMQYPTVELSYTPGVFKIDWSNEDN